MRRKFFGPQYTGKQLLVVCLWQIASLILCASLAWVLLAWCDFGYRYWFELLNIDAFIQEMGPKNKFKPGFARLSSHDYAALFTQINEAIHTKGQGLAQIQYQIPVRQELLTVDLLRPAEITHLQDVANLISYLRAIILGVLLLWLSLSGWLWYNKLRDNSLNLTLSWRSLLLCWCLIITLSVLTALFGPTHLFYTLHTVVFPADHQWFFYYEESLMTTLMKAPDIFAAIAILWLALTLVIHWLIVLGCRYHFVRKTAEKHP